MTNGKRKFLLVILSWVYALALVLPTAAGWNGFFGYDPELGKCDFIKPDADNVHPRVIVLGIGFSLPMWIITVSYFTIWRTSTKSPYFLKHNW